MNKKQLSVIERQIIQDKVEDCVAPYKGKRRLQEAFTMFQGAGAALETLGYEYPPYWTINMLSGRVDRLIGPEKKKAGLDTRLD